MHPPIATPIQHHVTPHPRRVFAVRAARSTAVLALLTAAVAATGAAVPSPPSGPVATPVSIVAEPAADITGAGEEHAGFGAPDVGLPRFAGEGLPEGTSQLAAEVRAGSTALSASSYAATTPDELAEMRRDARAALVRAAIAAGIPVDLSRFAEVGDVDLASLGRLAWPLAGGHITDVFGARGGRHMGLDIAAPAGTPLGAAAPGIVILSSESYFGYGVAVMILHVDGMVTLYGHLTHGSRVVEAGDWVEAGDPIGLVGNTGRSFGPHLHLEVRIGGVQVDPLRYLTGDATRPVIKPWKPEDVPSTPQPAAVPTAPKPSQTATPTPKPTPAGTPTAKPTPSGTPTPSPAPTGTPTPTPSPSGTPAPTPAPTPGGTPTTPSTPTPTAPAPTPTTPPSQAPAQEPPKIPATGTPAPTSPAPTSTPTGASVLSAVVDGLL